MTHSPAKLWEALTVVLAAVGAVAVGFLLAGSGSSTTWALLGLGLIVLSIPLLLRWHGQLVFWSWNASLLVFFLPGQPHVWMLLAGLSLVLSVLGGTLDQRVQINVVPAVTWTLLAFLMVVLVTAQLRGGIGIRSLGGKTYGGKRYILILAAVVGYFALSLLRVPAKKALHYMAGWCLGTLTLAMSNVAYTLGPAFFWLFAFFPVELAIEQATTDFTGGALRRLSGLSFAMLGPFCLMLLCYGIRGLLDWRRPWRLALFLSIVTITLLGGFRSLIILYGLLLLCHFSLEGLWRTRYTLIVGGVLLLGTIAVVPVVRHLPLAIQRSLSFLPIDVDPQARYDAEGSSDWRLQMWRLLWAQVPDYIVLGKGYTLDPMDLYFAQESLRRGFIQNYETAMIAGDFHSGPLSLLIGFGLPGVVTAIAFLIAGWRVVRANFQRGPPELCRINTFLYAYFLCRVVFFFGVFGDISSDLAQFTGIVGISVALNGGVRSHASAPAVAPAAAPSPQPT